MLCTRVASPAVVLRRGSCSPAAPQAVGHRPAGGAVAVVGASVMDLVGGPSACVGKGAGACAFHRTAHLGLEVSRGAGSRGSLEEVVQGVVASCVPKVLWRAPRDLQLAA